MEHNEVNIINGSVVGVHLGPPMQDATPRKPEDNEAYVTERNTVTRVPNAEETWEEQPSPSGGLDLAELEKNPLSGKYVEGMGWSEGGGENLFNGAEPTYDSGDENFSLGSPRININKSYDITIRGDVYKNVAPVKFNSYYPEVCWGNPSAYDIAADAEYPFQVIAGWLDATDDDGNPIWDNNGDFVGKPSNVDSWMYPRIRVSRDKYPDLKPEDVQIAECEIIHPIDPKYLPNVLVTINLVSGGDGSISASMKGVSFAEILSALKSGAYVCVYFKNADSSMIYVGMINNFNDELICVYDFSTSSYFVILPDNSVVLD